MPAPYLLTPGPLTTSRGTKEAMLRDWGSRDPAFIALNARVRERLLDLAGGRGSHVCVPLQGSGTFIVEAMLGTLVPAAGKLLVLANGAYGQRMVKIAERAGRAVAVQATPEDVAVSPAALDARLAPDPAVTDVAVVHCETTSGILNPVEEFGACRWTPRARRSTRWLPVEQVPRGRAGHRLRRRASLVAGGGARAVAVRLPRPARAVGRDAGDRAMALHPAHARGRGARPRACPARRRGCGDGTGARYHRNCQVLLAGLRDLGFHTLLPDALQAPIIVTVRMPADPRFSFEALYEGLSCRGFLIYPGKLTVADSFRIGCIGRVGEAQMRGVCDAIRDVLGEMRVTSLAPAAR